jgi:hypothetical protein
MTDDIQPETGTEKAQYQQTRTRPAEKTATIGSRTLDDRHEVQINISGILLPRTFAVYNNTRSFSFLPLFCCKPILFFTKQNRWKPAFSFLDYANGAAF